MSVSLPMNANVEHMTNVIEVTGQNDISCRIRPYLTVLEQERDVDVSLPTNQRQLRTVP